MLELAKNSMGAHISQFQPGTYKKAHRHGPGAHVIILDGAGFSTLWCDQADVSIKLGGNKLEYEDEEVVHRTFEQELRSMRHPLMAWTAHDCQGALPGLSGR